MFCSSLGLVGHDCCVDASLQGTLLFFGHRHLFPVATSDLEELSDEIVVSLGLSKRSRTFSHWARSYLLLCFLGLGSGLFSALSGMSSVFDGLLCLFRCLGSGVLLFLSGLVAWLLDNDLLLLSLENGFLSVDGSLFGSLDLPHCLLLHLFGDLFLLLEESSSAFLARNTIFVGMGFHSSGLG